MQAIGSVEDLWVAIMLAAEAKRGTMGRVQRPVSLSLSYVITEVRDTDTGANDLSLAAQV